MRGNLAVGGAVETVYGVHPCDGAKADEHGPSHSPPR